MVGVPWIPTQRALLVICSFVCCRLHFPKQVSLCVSSSNLWLFHVFVCLVVSNDLYFAFSKFTQGGGSVSSAQPHGLSQNQQWPSLSSTRRTLGPGSWWGWSWSERGSVDSLAWSSLFLFTPLTFKASWYLRLTQIGHDFYSISWQGWKSTGVDL